MLRTLFRLSLLALVTAGPLLAIGQVRAGDDRFIGQTPVYSNGAGLIAISVQRW